MRAPEESTDQFRPIRPFCADATWLLDVQRKVLTPNDFDPLAKLEAALLGFQQRYKGLPLRFQWTFTHEDLAKVMIRLNAKALNTAA